jgi:hypothetical protein
MKVTTLYRILLASTQEELGSSLHHDTSYPDWGVFVFFFSLDSQLSFQILSSLQLICHFAVQWLVVWFLSPSTLKTWCNFILSPQPLQFLTLRGGNGNITGYYYFWASPLLVYIHEIIHLLVHFLECVMVTSLTDFAKQWGHSY